MKKFCMVSTTVGGMTRNARKNRSLFSRIEFHNFTLVELLIVIAVISILAGMLLPALNSARMKARAISCTNQLSQLGKATHIYSDDYNGFLPLTSGNAVTWVYLLAGRIGSKYKVYIPSETLLCPEIEERTTLTQYYGSYGMYMYSEDSEYEGTKKPYFGKFDYKIDSYNYGYAIKRLRQPTELALFADTVRGKSATEETYKRSTWNYRPDRISNSGDGVYLAHEKTAGICWGDGHATQSSAAALHGSKTHVKQIITKTYDTLVLE